MKVYAAKRPRIYPDDPERRAIHFYLRASRRKELSVEDVVEMLAEAGITIWDVGQQPGQYALGRYGDTGRYTRDNCRFITIGENTWEREDRSEDVLEERRSKRRESQAETMEQLGRHHQLPKRVVFRGVEYPSLTDCSRKTGIAAWSLRHAKKYQQDLRYI